MWELERRTNLFKSHWKAPYWPTDGAAKMKWVALEGSAYARHPFIPTSVEESKIAASWRFKSISHMIHIYIILQIEYVSHRHHIL